MAKYCALRPGGTRFYTSIDNAEPLSRRIPHNVAVAKLLGILLYVINLLLPEVYRPPSVDPRNMAIENNSSEDDNPIDDMEGGYNLSDSDSDIRHM